VKTSRIVSVLSALALITGAHRSDAASSQSVAEFSHERIAFTPCPESPTLECGTLRLPIDYKAPWGERFDLAVVRAKATGKRIGVHFVHPGGHASGIDFILAGAGAPPFEAARERFDLVSIDPRGAGRTRPFRCGRDLPEAPTDPSEEDVIAYLDATGRLFAEQCLDEDRAFVLSINGTNFARDIDAVRAALGERQLTLTMFSNSAPVGAVYARLFPRRVRALVLDSGVGPDFKDYLIQRIVDQKSSYETVLQRLDYLCRNDAACRLSREGVVATYDAVFASLQHAPVVSPDGRELTAADLTEILNVALPVESFGPPFVDALADAQGGDFGLLFLFQTLTGGPAADDSFLARFCNDYGTRRTAADYLTIERADTGAHPFGPLVTAEAAALCSAWPAAHPPVIENVDRRLAVPIVLVGAEFDSDAPFAWTQRLAQAVGTEARVIRYRGAGHGLSTRGIPCVSEALAAYLNDLRPPVDGLSCPAAPTVFGGAATSMRAVSTRSWGGAFKEIPR